MLSNYFQDETFSYNVSLNVHSCLSLPTSPVLPYREVITPTTFTPGGKGFHLSERKCLCSQNVACIQSRGPHVAMDAHRFSSLLAQEESNGLLFQSHCHLTYHTILSRNNHWFLPRASILTIPLLCNDCVDLNNLLPLSFSKAAIPGKPISYNCIILLIDRDKTIAH